MTNKRETQITASHLGRKAVVYVRQSGKKQLLHARSIAYQREQVSFPTLWGWPPDLIEVIDDDLGLGGGTTVMRAGYRRMLAEVGANRIGAIFIADITRAARNAQDWQDLIEMCRQHDVLVVVDGKIYQPDPYQPVGEATGQ